MTLRLLIMALSGALAVGPAPSPNSGPQGDLQAILDGLEQRAGGATYALRPGQKVAVRNGITLPRGITLDLNGGELVATLDDANAAGVRMLSGSTLRNGTVTVISRGTPGNQAGAHAAVLVGALYGENAAPDRLSGYAAPSGWTISNVTLRTDKLVAAGNLRLGAPGIQVVGGAHDGLIEGVTIPSSDRMAGGVLLDWGTVGPISSGDVAGSSAAFLAGKAFTTHPHDITIRDITIGRLTRPAVSEAGSFGVRISGAYDISVSGVRIAEVTEAGFQYTAGDLGFEFARPVDRARAHQGIVLDGMVADRAGAYVVRADSYADNVGRAAALGYRPHLPPIAPTDIVVRDVTGSYSGAGRPGFGLRLDHQRGGTFADLAMRGFPRCFVVDEQVYDVELLRPSATDCRDGAVNVEHPSRPPARVRIVDARVAGTTERARMVTVGRSEDVTVTGSGSAILRVTAQARRASVPNGANLRRD